jgi:hypothetical protein
MTTRCSVPSVTSLVWLLMMMLSFLAWCLQSSCSDSESNITRAVNVFHGRKRCSTSPSSVAPSGTREGHAHPYDLTLTYGMYHSWVKRLGEELGYLQTLTTYCLRRALGNAINGMAPFCLSLPPNEFGLFWFTRFPHAPSHTTSPQFTLRLPCDSPAPVSSPQRCIFTISSDCYTI